MKNNVLISFIGYQKKTNYEMLGTKIRWYRMLICRFIMLVKLVVNGDKLVTYYYIKSNQNNKIKNGNPKENIVFKSFHKNNLKFYYFI